VIEQPADVADRLVREMEQSDSVMDLDGPIIELDEPVQPRVSLTEHDAICLSVIPVELKKWKRKAWFFRFQIREVGPANNVILPGYVNLGDLDKEKSFLKRKAAEPKIKRWWRIIVSFDSTYSPKYVDLRAFKKFLFRVRVVDVRKDNVQRDIPEAGRYQKVDEITAIIGRIESSR
jgi:hypothetical protein